MERMKEKLILHHRNSEKEPRISWAQIVHQYINVGNIWSNEIFLKLDVNDPSGEKIGTHMENGWVDLFQDVINNRPIKRILCKGKY